MVEKENSPSMKALVREASEEWVVSNLQICKEFKDNSQEKKDWMILANVNGCWDIVGRGGWVGLHDWYKELFK